MSINILWADDEIDLLKPHVLFLEKKGYHVETVNNGHDAVELTLEKNFDIVFLDENMPGISGLDALKKIKEKSPSLPIVMITKSEEESIMESAIGRNISDYLIKPVNPNQILLSLKKNIDQDRLIEEETNHSYQQEFREISMQLMNKLDSNEWKELYKKLVYWELSLDKTQEDSMTEILNMQKREANQQFCKFIEENYQDWVNSGEDAPIMSHTLVKNKILSELNEPTFLLVIDNLRYDQWRVLRPFFSKYFTINDEDLYFSILPTATQYARNAIFAGLMPSEIEKRFPNMWTNEDDEGSKNQYEKEFMEDQLLRLGKNFKFSYTKILELSFGKKVVDNFNNLLGNHLNIIVYNFVDMLSHARTDMKVIKELADDESAYRSITESWFEHSPIHDLIRKIAEKKWNLIITTDHGTIKVNEPTKVIGTKDLNTNLRYKVGKNMSFDEKDLFVIDNPSDIKLPTNGFGNKFIFTKSNDFFAYPNNFNHYVKHYQDTFQHGGISMEEVLVPIISMKAK